MRASLAKHPPHRGARGLVLVGVTIMDLLGEANAVAAELDDAPALALADEALDPARHRCELCPNHYLRKSDLKVRSGMLCPAHFCHRPCFGPPAHPHQRGHGRSLRTLDCTLVFDRPLCPSWSCVKMRITVEQTKLTHPKLFDKPVPWTSPAEQTKLTHPKLFDKPVPWTIRGGADVYLS